PIGYPGAGMARIALTNLDTGSKQEVDAGLSSSDGGTTWTGKGYGDLLVNGGTIDIGAHSAVATFTNPSTNQVSTSGTVNFTISPIYEGLMCDTSGPMTARVWAPGQSVTITMQSENTGSLPLDWTKGTASITLKGPITVTYSHLSMDSAGNATFTAPTTVGFYEIACSVSGVPNYTLGDTGFSSPSYLVSEGHEFGAVKLYTNPRTLTTGVPIQMYIVFVAAPGIPTPTGEFTVYIGSGSQFLFLQNGAHIGSGGATSISLAPISNLYGANSITINYFGDPYYKPQEWTFTMTNPSIPGSGGSAGNGTTSKKPTATPKPRATATAGAIATPAGVSTGSGAATSQENKPLVLGAFGPLSGGGLIALIVLIALLALGGGVGAFALLSRRGRSVFAAPTAVEAAPQSDAPTLSDGSPLGWPVDGPSGPSA
ncbi:MAG: hypothetical protein KGO05_15745, partial [Chloroflexota bacterium]|nr:hypothetical protein [Chloroflexota bacterium]